MQDKLIELERQYRIDWHEYKISDLFDKKTIKGIPKSIENMTPNKEGFNVFGQNIKYQYPFKTLNDSKYLQEVVKGKPIFAYTSSVGEVGIINESFYRTGDNGAFQGLFPKYKVNNLKIARYILAVLKKYFKIFDYGTSMADVINLKIILPTQNSEIAFDYIEEFISTLEAERLATLEAYLLATGLNDYKLTSEEAEAISSLESIEWTEFELNRLFGKATRGKRLKAQDRILGEVPFVTAGETNMGISAFIDNKVQVFSKNTITIDMFGSAKYRNYSYGADDHVAVVHTENLDKYSALFTTSSINKSSHAGQFDYSRNFYATDADELIISLPIKSDGQIDYDFMSTLIRAVQKEVIRGVVEYLDKRIVSTNKII